MFSKQGQLSMFIIVGIVAIIGISLLAFTQPKAITGNIASQNLETPEVSALVESCLQDVTKQGLFYLGQQGGYYEPPPGLEYVTGMVPYYVDADQVYVPGIPTIEFELNKYIEEYIDDCARGFESLEEQGFSVSALTPSANAKIGSDSILVDINYPLEVSKGSSTVTFSDFSASIPFNFNDVYKVVDEVMQQQKKDPLSVHFEFLANSAYDNQYFFELIQMEENKIIYSLTFNNLRIDNQPYVFNFAAKYDW